MQSTVDWNRRGTVTSANMFSRFLGQSLGAAVFGAVSNAALRDRLAAAPHLRGLPSSADGITRILQNDPASPAAAYLRAALSTAIHHVYLGLVATAVLVALTLALTTPRRFPVVSRTAGSATGHAER